MMIVHAAVAIIIVSMIGMLSYYPATSNAQQAAQLPAQQEPPRATQLPAQPQQQQPPTATQLPVLPQDQSKHLPVETAQDDHVIVTTVTKTNKPVGPIVILPPKEEGGNSTIVEPGQNVTNNNNETIIIKPDGNITQIPNGNVTEIDNETVIITEPGRNITETPGNVTVVDPPVATQLPVFPNQNGSNTNTNTNNTNNQPCTCNNNNTNNNANQSGQQLPPVVIRPAPGQNVTQIPGNTTMPPPFQQQQPNVNQTNDQGSGKTENALLRL